MVSVNELGLDLFEELVENADLFNVAYHELDNGARIVDCGVAVPGGFGAGDYFTRICMGGLGDLAFRQGMVGKFPMTFIDVNTDFPAISCLGAQKAGWTVKHENFFAMAPDPHVPCRSSRNTPMRSSATRMSAMQLSSAWKQTTSRTVQ